MSKVLLLLVFVLASDFVYGQNTPPLGEWIVQSGEFNDGPKSWDTLLLVIPRLDTSAAVGNRIWKTITLEKDQLIWTKGSLGIQPKTNEVFSSENSVSTRIRLRKKCNGFEIRTFGDEKTKLKMTPNAQGWLLTQKRK